MKSLILTGTGILIVAFVILLFSCKENLSRGNNNLPEVPLPAKIGIDPLAYRWTFGNHEPISMYRRAGNRITGGIEGSALWLEDWHHWFDSEASASLMEELGLNILHSRFYKGMGWEYESHDFPNVKQFVDNCHKHGVTVLAYVQFSTLYYEIMLSEIPDLAKWVALDENGQKRTWHNAVYYRWVPCANSPDFEKYLKKVIKIALTEGGFDGIQFDNCDVPFCYCPHCVELFREFLTREPNPERQFGIPSLEHVLPPIRKPEYGEIQDPVYQQWIQFRCNRVTALFQRLYNYAKSCKSSAIVSGNIQNIRRGNMAGANALDMAGLSNCFDIFLSQSGNAPGFKDGCIINRVREMKLARALNTPILALCDDDAGLSEAKYVLTLMEDAVFGGFPTDRTVIRPDPEMVSPQLVAFRRPLLQRFNETVRVGHEGLAAPEYTPVKVLYSYESITFSEQAYKAVLGAEEILLRNHVPYGLLPVTAAKPLAIPSDCEVLLVCDQRCLADTGIDTLIQFARRGGRLVVTGNTGEYDEFYRQRHNNPLTKGLDGCRNAVKRTDVYLVPVRDAGWTIRVAAPADGGRSLMEDIVRVWSPEIRIQAPSTVFVEVKRSEKAFYVHMLNYTREPVSKGARIEVSVKRRDLIECTFAAPMENRPATPIETKTIGSGWRVIDLPAFNEYAVVNVKNY